MQTKICAGRSAVGGGKEREFGPCPACSFRERGTRRDWWIRYYFLLFWVFSISNGENLLSSKSNQITWKVDHEEEDFSEIFPMDLNESFSLENICHRFFEVKWYRTFAFTWSFFSCPEGGELHLEPLGWTSQLQNTYPALSRAHRQVLHRKLVFLPVLWIRN